MPRYLSRLSAVITVSAVTLLGGLIATPANAVDDPSTSSSSSTDASRETSTKWQNTLRSNQAKYGAGDKAELETAKQITPLRVSYCSSYSNLTRSDGWFKIPDSGGSFNCVLEQGTSGNGVRALQETLNKCYGRGLTVDGSFGPATYNALMYAQGRAGVAVDGVYGSNTRTSILWWGGGSICKRGSSIGI